MNWRALRIMATTADQFGLTVSDLTGRDRHKTTVVARHVAMSLVRERLSLSYPEIGKLFMRDHTTVMANVEAARVRRESDTEWADAFTTAETALLPWREEQTIERLEVGA